MFSVKIKSDTLFKKASLANKETEPTNEACDSKKVIEMLVRQGHMKLVHDSEWRHMLQLRMVITQLNIHSGNCQVFHGSDKSSC
jgi:hypothetical protein